MGMFDFWRQRKEKKLEKEPAPELKPEEVPLQGLVDKLSYQLADYWGISNLPDSKIPKVRVVHKEDKDYDDFKSMQNPDVLSSYDSLKNLILINGDSSSLDLFSRGKDIISSVKPVMAEEVTHFLENFIKEKTPDTKLNTEFFGMISRLHIAKKVPELFSLDEKKLLDEAKLFSDKRDRLLKELLELKHKYSEVGMKIYEKYGSSEPPKNEKIELEKLRGMVSEVEDKYNHLAYHSAASYFSEIEKMSPEQRFKLLQMNPSQFSEEIIRPIEEKLEDRLPKVFENTKEIETAQFFEKAEEQAAVGAVTSATAETADKLEEKLAEVVINNKILYHGSMTPRIKELQAAEENTVGQGAYLTSQEEAAKGYAIKRADEYKGSPTLYEVNIDNAKLIDLRDTKTLDKIFQGFNEFLKEKLKQGSLSWQREGVARSVIERISQKHYSTGTIKFTTENCGDWFSEYLQPKGYDGLIALEGGEGNIGDHDTYLFFNTSKPKITKEINLQPNERPELIAAAEAIEYKQEERKFEEKELKDNKKEIEITNEYIISNIAKQIYDQNSCSHVVDCALTSAGYLYSYSQMLKATKYNNSEISRQLEDLADSDILLSKLMIAISSSKAPTKLYQELVEKAMSYSPKFLNYLEESEKKEAETCLKNFRSAHTLVDVTTNFNRLLYLERNGFAIAHNKKDSKLPEDLEKLRIASNEKFSKKLTLESYDFLSSFDPDLSRDIFSRDTLSKDKIITSDEYSYGIRGLSFLHPKINPSLEEIKESQKKEKSEEEIAPKTSNAEQATLATTTALALPTTKAIQLITKGAVQPIRCTTCNKVFGSDAEFYNNQIHPCVRVRLRCPVCGSEDVD